MKTAPHTRSDLLPETFDELVRLFTPRAIHDEIDYRNTQEMIDRLTDLSQYSPGQEDYLDTLATLLAAYEKEHFPIDTSDIGAIEILKFLLDQNGWTASDLGRLLGDRALGSKILSGHRSLSKANIKALAERFGVSPALFLD